MTTIELQGLAAKQAARVLSIAGTAKKNAGLNAIADALLSHQNEILAANARDLENGKSAGLSTALLDRLALSPERIEGIVAGVRQVAALPDPIGEVTKMSTRPNGLTIGKKRVPLGVIGIIFEARPNVTVDAAILCLKSGNATILRGGKEAISTNTVLADIMRKALVSEGLPAACVCLVADTSRESANELMGLTDYLDVLIPRGGAGLIRSVVEHAKVPVIETGTGICHIYVDSEADLDMAANIVYNAKCSRPSVCNAAECVLVARSVAAAFLPKANELLKQKNTQLRCDPESLALLGEAGIAANDADWDTEFGDYTLAVKIVTDVDEAMDFIALHGTGHSECIVSQNYFTVQRFLNEVDAAAVYANASTRFTDGFEFGLGAEIGISTQKMHARGPMGLEELTSSKYTIYGTGQVR